MYEAEFTSTSMTRPVCQRCKASFPPGTALYHIHSKNPSEPGRDLCEGCRAYYLQKGTTQRREDPAQEPTSSTPVRNMAIMNMNVNDSGSHSSIRRNIAAAQRGESSQSVVAIGNTVLQGTSTLPTNGAVHSSGRRSTYQTVNIVPPINTASSRPFPAKLKAPPVKPGYQEAHAYYIEMRTHYQNMAFSNVANAEVITAKFCMMTRVPSKKNPAIVSDILEAIPHIPVHIGCFELKKIAYFALLPHYIKWSRNYPLSIDELTLRTKNWVELLPKHPDVDAIAEKFFDFRGSKSKVKVFSPKQGIDLYLEISYSTYNDILEHVDRLSIVESTGVINSAAKENSFGIQSSKRRLIEGSPIKSKQVGKKRKLDDRDNEESEVIIRTNHRATFNDTATRPAPAAAPSPKSNATISRALTTVRSEQVRKALEFQLPPRRNNMKMLFDTVTISLRFFRLPKVTFSDLINNRGIFLDPQGFESAQIELNYNPVAAQSAGGFKIASFGNTSTPIFGGAGPGATKVCFKQRYSTKPGTRERQVHQGLRQAEDLTMELNCIGWASTLMNLVYEHMEAERTSRGWPAFVPEVPRMQYVQAGLAISMTDRQLVYLIEEYINSDSNAGGWFVKYINNRSAIPRTFSEEGKSIRAEFLSFAQHLQYWKTDGLVFVSDIQGGRELLTDPQIITAPELGNIFADGNTNFTTFAKEHVCNRFCDFYEIPKLNTPAENASQQLMSARIEELDISDSDSVDFPDRIQI